MKIVVPFYPLYVSTPREDYFKLCADITGGDIIPSNKTAFFKMVKNIFNRKVHAQGNGFPFPVLCPLFAKETVYSFVNNFIGQKWYAVLARRYLLNRCRIVIVNSEYNKNNFIKQGIRREILKVLPFPSDYGYFSKPRGAVEFRKKFGLGADEKFVMSYGVGYHKNPEVIAEACRKAGIRLVIVGFKDKKESENKYPGFKASDKIVREDNNTIITGYITTEELLGAYDAATVFANSSDEDGEVFAIMAYDAASAGVPLCLPDYGTFSVFEGCALFHKNHDSEGLAENILRYLNNPEIISENTRKAKIVAEKYDYAHVKEQFKNFYREIGFI